MLTDADAGSKPPIPCRAKESALGMLLAASPIGHNVVTRGTVE
jgi:hypothetical protein